LKRAYFNAGARKAFLVYHARAPARVRYACSTGSVDPW